MLWCCTVFVWLLLLCKLNMNERKLSLKIIPALVSPIKAQSVLCIIIHCLHDVLWKWGPALPGCPYLTMILLQCQHNKFLYNKKKTAVVHTVLETGRGGGLEREGRGWGALKPGLLPWHGSPFSSPCKVFTISLSVASLSHKWGQRITWRGGKRSRSGKAFVRRMANLSPVAFPGKRGIFFPSFLLLNPQSLVGYSGGRWRRSGRRRKKKKKTWGPLRDLNLFKCERAFCFCNPVKNGHLIRPDISGQREPVC